MDKLWIEFVVSDEFLRELGHVIVQWAYFETEFDEFVSLLQLDPAVTALAPEPQFSFKGRTTLFKAAVAACFSGSPVLSKRLLSILKRAQSAKQMRDWLAHCRWSGDPSDGFLYSALHKRAGISQRKITLTTLKTISLDISALSRELRSVMHAGQPVNDFSFPLSPEELAVMQDFKRKNIPPLPAPRII